MVYLSTDGKVESMKPSLPYIFCSLDLLLRRKLSIKEQKFLVSTRLVVLESGLGLESGLKFIFAALWLGFELEPKGLGHGLETAGLGV